MENAEGWKRYNILVLFFIILYLWERIILIIHINLYVLWDKLSDICKYVGIRLSLFNYMTYENYIWYIMLFLYRDK